ncbi:MAG: hypothetical protein L0Z62_32810 [Gemmataceae bacterium]|nr:hypothetical protein [Gemmataceae bacterium]
MIELTETQSQALAVPGATPEVFDPRTQARYVLVRAEVFERLRAALEEEMPEVGPLVNEVMAEDDADDPYLEGYQKYRREQA